MKYDPETALMRNKLASALENMFEKAGFKLDASTQKERVFSRYVTSDIKIVVYSTIVGAEVRTYGSDAIRIVVLSVEPDEKAKTPIQTFGLAKEQRVFRVGEIEGIVSRTLERMRSAWVKAKNTPRCRRCQAPLFVTKNNKRACSRICWR